MAKHPRKKQKLNDRKQATAPLGSKNGPRFEEKDEEERRLESLVFDSSFKSSDRLLEAAGLDGVDGLLVDDGTNDGDMTHLLDSELFFVDDSGRGKEHGKRSATENATHNDGEKEEVSISDVHPPEPLEYSSPAIPQAGSSTQKRSAWVDPDDETLQVSLTETKRSRKLRDDLTEDVVSGSRYESKLRREFERIQPVPEWASKAKSRVKAKRRRSSNAEDDDNADGLDNLLSTADGILKAKEKDTPLQKGVLTIERLRDANISAKAQGQLKALQFHPSAKVPLLFTASSDRRIRLFNVDGHTNPHIQTVHISQLPITSACYHPTGSSILITGERPQYYVFDLQTGKTTSSPRGLWGTFARTQYSTVETSDMTMEICAFDPTGNILAVGGRRGVVHLVDWSSGSGTQVIGSVKMNSPVRALCWTRGRGGSQSQLLSLSEDADVYHWDVAERRCINRWKDDGGFASLTMSTDKSDNYLSIGSRSGIVNVYKQNGTSKPQHLKALDNLTTAISTMRFNHDSQVLAIASKAKVDQMRVVHLPSLSVFSNWPTSGTPLGHVTAIDFSPESDYIAIGNHKGRVLLYQLGHFRKS